ncbi:MAG: hypothetical protein AAF433_15130 [Bacteroidota bacterium]
MQKINVLITIFLLTVTGLFAQFDDMTNATVDYDGNVYTATQINLEIPQDKVKDYWDNYWDERFDIDVDREDRNRRSEVFLAEEVSIPAVNDKSFDLWSKLTELDEVKTTVSLTFSFGYDISANPENYPVAYRKSQEYLDEFSAFAYERYFDEQIEELQSQLNDLRDDREDAVDDQQKSNRRIERWMEKIEKLEGRIADERAEINEEENIEVNKEQRIAELERDLSSLERRKRSYLLR